MTSAVQWMVPCIKAHASSNSFLQRVCHYTKFKSAQIKSDLKLSNDLSTANTPQVLFPARTTPFTTTTSRSNVEDLKSLRRGKEAVPAKSKEVSKKKYRRLRKVKKRRRRKKDRNSIYGTTETHLCKGGMLVS